jgi:hypothetical protein
MDESVRRAQSVLPVGIDRVTREPVTLGRALAEPGVLAGTDELTTDERVAVLTCGDEIDLARGIAELEAQSPSARDPRDLHKEPEPES